MSGENRKKRSFKEYLRIYVTGLIMGGADVVPGVSGGTMAFILGIYEELIESIKRFTSAEAIAMGLKFQVKKAFQTLPWPFLLALGLGIVTAIVLLSSPIHWMLANRPVLIWAFFFGLVVASIFTVFGRVRKWNPAVVVALIAGTVAGWVVVGLPLLNNPPDAGKRSFCFPCTTFYFKYFGIELSQSGHPAEFFHRLYDGFILFHGIPNSILTMTNILKQV